MFEGMFGGRFHLTLAVTVWCVSAAQRRRRRPRPHSDKIPANRRRIFTNRGKLQERLTYKELAWVDFSWQVLSKPRCRTMNTNIFHSFALVVSRWCCHFKLVKLFVSSMFCYWSRQMKSFFQSLTLVKRIAKRKRKKKKPEIIKHYIHIV